VGLAGSPEVSSVELLLGPDGAAALTAALTAGSSMRAGELLRHSYPADLVAAALTQLDLRSRAASKFPDPERLLFTRAGLEQASSARVAAHRAARFASYTRVVDLCTGIGGDLLALAAVVPHVLAVDRDPTHLRLAAHNAAAAGLGDRVDTWLGDVEAADLSGVEAAFVDPARRSGGRRLTSAEGSPSLDWPRGCRWRSSARPVSTTPSYRLGGSLSSSRRTATSRRRRCGHPVWSPRYDGQP
jgi:RNA cap guanine-N2 methyltransferase